MAATSAVKNALALRSTPRICLTCRSLLDTDHCEHAPNHRVTSLATPEGRAALLTEVWGPPSRRRRARQLAKAGGAGGGAGALEACSACDGVGGADPQALIIILAVALVAIVLYWVGSMIWRAIQNHRHRLKPNGALNQRQLAPPAARLGVGLIEGESFRAPASGDPCVAYRLELQAKSSIVERTLLRHDHTQGFTVELESGDRLVVPAGRVRIWGGTAERHRRPHEDVNALVQKLSRGFPASEQDYPPFPFDVAIETRLERGTRIEIRGDVEAHATLDAKGPYRERAKRELRPVGVLDLVVV